MCFHSDNVQAGKQGRKVVSDNLTPTGGVGHFSRSKLADPSPRKKLKKHSLYREYSGVSGTAPQATEKTRCETFRPHFPVFPACGVLAGASR